MGYKRRHLFKLSSLEQLNIDIVTELNHLAGRRIHFRFPDGPKLEVSISNIWYHRGERRRSLTNYFRQTEGIYEICS